MSVIFRTFQPLWDALFCRGIDFTYRWRLLGLLPINLLANSMKWLPRLFSNAYTVTWIPLRRSPDTSLRALVFKSEQMAASPAKLRPIHLDIHGGGFTGGIPEMDAPFCAQIAQETGAVVISITYRIAPRHVFPTAHEDVQDIAAFVVENAERLWGADPRLLTLSGFSVGGNLALGISQHLAGTDSEAKGSVTFYNPVDFRLSPWEKPKPPGFPQTDPLFFLQPLFDSYVNKARPRCLENPLMNPIVADIRSLPTSMLFIIPEVDILLDEQTKFVERLKREADILNSHTPLGPEAGGDRDLTSADRHSSKYRVESLFFKGQIHGWLELPSAAIDETTRTEAFRAASDFIRDVHAAHGWSY